MGIKIHKGYKAKNMAPKRDLMHPFSPSTNQSFEDFHKIKKKPKNNLLKILKRK
tara:strand:- start:302 stop:463 length:162 start_codon:yes stop_codon:yes gene_type:complete